MKKRKPLIHCLWLVVGILIVPAPVVSADYNGNGLRDADDIAAGRSEDCNGNGLPDECEAAPPPFGARTGVAVNVTAPEPAVADFNGDGILDLAVGATGSGGFGVSVFLGGEDRQFEALGRRLGSFREINRMRTADLNGDGAGDVVLLDIGGVRAFINEGAGDFSERVSVSTRDDLNEIAIGDMNGDGFDDVVAALISGDLITVIVSHGDGTYEHIEDYPVNAPRGVAVADVDGDGDKDAVVTGGECLTIFNNTGDGTLTPVAQGNELGENPRMPVFGDLNGDDLPDLAVVTDARIDLLVNRSGESFDVMRSFHLGEETGAATSIALGDVDLDGDSDVILGLVNTGAPGAVLFFINDGAGFFRFTPLVELPAPPRGASARDLDGDGDVELFVTDRGNGIDIRYNDGHVLDAPSPLSFVQDLLPLSDNFEPHVTALVDIDGDGDEDLVTMDGEELVMVLPKGEDGLFQEGDRYRLDGASELIAIVAVDLDNDGDVDVAGNDEATDRLLILENQGDGTFVQLEEQYDTGNRPAFLAAADLNGDGLQDLLSVNATEDTVGIFFNLGDAVFEPEVAVEAGDRPVAAATGDFDGDGDSDMAVVNANAATLAVFRNEDSGTFGEPVEHDTDVPRYVSATDLDGDGDLDLVVAYEGTERLGLFGNDGAGTFEFLRDLEVGQPPRSVIASDLNGDGKTDLVTANERADSISLFLQLADGAYTPPFTYRVGANPRYVLAADVEADGDVDLIAANHSSHDFSLLYSEPPVVSAPPYLEGICTELDFYQLSVPSGTEFGITRRTRFLVPLEGAGLPLLFDNVQLYASQREFLADAFPELFPDVTADEYDRLVGRRATRRYYSGELVQLRSRGVTAYGFSVLVSSPYDPQERLTEEEVRSVYGDLSAGFTLGPLAYVPDSSAAREDAAAWDDLGFHVVMAMHTRADATSDGAVNLADAVFILQYLYGGGPALLCESAGDANDDGAVDLSDAVTILLHLFVGAGTIPEPAAGCGWDPTPDRLPCIEFPPCDGG